MSSFKQLRSKHLLTSATVAPTSSLLRPSRRLLPVLAPAPKPAPSVTQAELERAVRLGHSFARIPLFPPASDDAHTQGEPLQGRFEPTQNKENTTGLPSDLKTGIENPSQFPIQAKLMIGPAHNQYEQEADQMADRVMGMNVAQTDEQALQHAKQPEEEELKLRKEPEIQRASADAGFEAGSDFESRIAASKSSGSPLPDSVRAFMEPRFGVDFSGVRLHTDSESAQLNRAVNAQAFTRGQEIYLGEGKSDLATSEGKRLLAHELTHTIQQGAVSRKINPSVQQKPTLQTKTVPIRGEDPVLCESEIMGAQAPQLKERKRQQLSRGTGPKASTMSNIATGLIVQRTIWTWTGGKWKPQDETKNPPPKLKRTPAEGDTYDDATATYTAAVVQAAPAEWRRERGAFTPIKGNPKDARADLEKMLSRKPLLYGAKPGTVVGGEKIKGGTKIQDLSDPSARIDIQAPPGEGLYNVQYQKGTGSVCGIRFTGDDLEDTLYEMLKEAFAEGDGVWMVSPSYDIKYKAKDEKTSSKKGKGSGKQEV